MKIKIPAFMEGTEEEEQLVDAQIKLKTLQKQTQQANAAINRLSQKNASVLNLTEMFTNALIEYLPTKLKNVSEKKSTNNGKTLVIADMHFDGKPDSVKDLQRLGNIIQTNKFEKIIFGGDTIDGVIRASDRFKGSLEASQQAIAFFDGFSQILNSINYKPKLYIVYGNHEEIRQYGDEYGDDTANWAEILSNYLSIAGYEVEHGIRLYDKSTKTYMVHGDKDDKKGITGILIDNVIKYNIGRTKYVTSGTKLKRVYQETKVNRKNVDKVFRFHFHYGLLENKNGIDYIQFPSFYTGNRPYDTKIGKKSLGMYAIINEKGEITFGK